MKSRRAVVVGVLAVFLVGTLSGCLGGPPSQEVQKQADIPKELNQREVQKKFEELAAKIPSNFSFPLQKLNTHKRTYINGTIDTSAMSAVAGTESSGTDVNRLYIWKDIKDLIPDGQPVEITAGLAWQGDPGKSATLHLAIEVPGTKVDRDYNKSNPGDWDWNLVVKKLVVDTVGAAGQNHRIGVKVENAKILPGQTLQYSIRLEMKYQPNVLTPYYLYALDVPQGASSLLFHSVKAGGPEHIKAEFVVLDPEDNLVYYTKYDDINIPTETVLVPIKKPGEYLFYAYYMQGGFLEVKADVPVPNNIARAIVPKWEKTMVFDGSPKPGMAPHKFGADGGTIDNPVVQEGDKRVFSLKSFPLDVVGYASKEGTFAGDVYIKMSTSKGLVYEYYRTLRYDASEETSIGFSEDYYDPTGPYCDACFIHMVKENIIKGDYTMSVVVDGFNGEIGYMALNYKR
ncbi:MAG: hypothetical protein HY556_06345 [Euryarchaeota archaeon]|nr:hypothetical protein [Euryarchaeota archaeon]